MGFRYAGIETHELSWDFVHHENLAFKQKIYRCLHDLANKYGGILGIYWGHIMDIMGTAMAYQYKVVPWFISQVGLLPP